MELIIALTLSSLLMVAVLGVLNSLSRQRSVLLERRAPASWRQQLKEQLHRDFANARRVSNRPDELRLIGYGGRDFATGKPTHRPTEVVYAVHDVGDQHWLMRWEIHLDELTNQNVGGELVCAGVTAIDLLSLDDQEEPTFPDEPEPTGRDNDAEGENTFAATPNSTRVVLFASDKKSVMLDEVIYLRRVEQ